MPLNNNIELRSEEVQEVMNRIPPAIQRWGLTIMIFITVIFISIAFLVKIPITEECKFVITGEDQIMRPTAKILIPSSIIKSVMSNDSAEVQLYSDWFPQEYNSKISIVIPTKNLVYNSECLYEVYVQLPYDIKRSPIITGSPTFGKAYIIIYANILQQINK